MKEYTINDLIIRSPKQTMLRNLPLYGGETISAETLCLSIKMDAFLLGVNSVSYFKKGDWWYIFSDKDWFFLSVHIIQSIEKLFEQMHPFPEKGRNACRLECYIWALSKSVYTTTNDQLNVIKGVGRKTAFFQPNKFKKSYGRLLIFSDFTLDEK